MSENSDETAEEVKHEVAFVDREEGHVPEKEPAHSVDDEDDGDESETDDKSKHLPFKRRRRKRARTASERLKWDEKGDSRGLEAAEDAQGSSPSPPSPSRSTRTTTDNPQSSSDSSEEGEQGRIPRDTRRRRRKKVVLRPAVPGAPRNSTSFIIDSHVDISGLYYDFSSPTPASQRSDYFQHMQESFESEYSSARAVELEQMSRDELVSRIVQLEQRENELRKILEAYDPALIERQLHDTLIAEQEENRRLKSQLSKPQDNPFASDDEEEEESAASSGEESTSSSSSPTVSSSPSVSSKTNSK